MRGIRAPLAIDERLKSNLVEPLVKRRARRLQANDRFARPANVAPVGGRLAIQQRQLRSEAVTVLQNRIESRIQLQLGIGKRLAHLIEEVAGAARFAQIIATPQEARIQNRMQRAVLRARQPPALIDAGRIAGQVRCPTPFGRQRVGAHGEPIDFIPRLEPAVAQHAESLPTIGGNRSINDLPGQVHRRVGVEVGLLMRDEPHHVEAVLQPVENSPRIVNHGRSGSRELTGRAMEMMVEHRQRFTVHSPATSADVDRQLVRMELLGLIGRAGAWSIAPRGKTGAEADEAIFEFGHSGGKQPDLQRRNVRRKQPPFVTEAAPNSESLSA